MEPTHEMPRVSADPDPEGLLDPETVATAPTELASPPEGSRGTATAYGAWSDAQRALFALMAIAIFVLLIGLAANADSTEPGPPPEPEPRCWSFDDACCIEAYGWGECCDWYDDRDRNDDRGLFDAEERFADDPPRRERC